LVLQSVFGDKVSINKESVRRLCGELVNEIVDHVVECDWSRNLSTEMTGEEREELVNRLQELGLVTQLDNLQRTGEFLRYVPRALARIYREEFEKWDGTVFADDNAALSVFAPAAAAKYRDRIHKQILRAIDECVEFVDSPESDEVVLRRVKSSVNFLRAHIA
jgi:hypothetical protein